MLPRTGSKGQRERQQLTDRIVCDRDGFVMPEHGSRTPAAELSDQVRQSTEQAVDGARRYPGLGRQPTNRERFYAASPDDAGRHLQQAFPRLVIVFARSTHGGQNIATMLRYGDTKLSVSCSCSCSGVDHDR